MSVKIRLFKRGRKKLALFDVVIADARAPRDGKFIEKIGVYNPNTNPATIELNETKAFQWLMNGAQPTDTVKAMLSYKGLLFKKHLQIGVNKGAITQDEADKKLNEWLNTKTNKIDTKKSNLAIAKEKAQKAKLEAEAKVNAAREESIKNKNKVVEAAAEQPQATEEQATETTAIISEALTANVAADTAQATDIAPIASAAEEAPIADVVSETLPIAEAAVAPAQEAPVATAEDTAPVE
ncbi:MAG: 30S ribosomal protein S16 [Cytophagales bacterium]|nr:30S ribosomal protein S16 [Cytophagales bacterium]